jgi:general secretion pathway protein E
MKLLSYDDYPKESVVLDNLSIKFMKESVFVPLEIDGDKLRIAIADPDNFYTIDALKMAYRLRVEAVKGKPEDILETIDRLYGTGSQSMDMIIEEAGKDIENIAAYMDEDTDHLRDLASEAPIIRLVNRLILNAFEQRASDIHFEPFENVFKVRYRIDGVLHDAESPPVRIQSAIISRVKIMAKLDIAERRLPQDGRIKMKIVDHEIDFRVSTLPTLFGESLVMRILDRGNLILDFKKIGFPDDILSNYLELVKQPYGMILVTGPTGSGKTSTLYATLAHINSSETKIITLEDPVEYQLLGINQMQVNPKIGLKFANGLRSIVRQDPNVILVGEIRDRETAEIAIQSALTGHLLFSTLHTNDATGAITRLLDLGVENFLLSSTLLGILAQRLVRLICPKCKRETDPDEKLLQSMRIDRAEADSTHFYIGTGCEYCHHTGYRGRIAIFEFIKVDEDIRREINDHATTEQIKNTVKQKGVLTLREDGWHKVKAGLTTVSEVLRVTLDK